MTTGKTVTWTIRTIVSKVMSLLLNTLSRFVIAFLPRSKHLLISWLQLPYIFGKQQRYLSANKGPYSQSYGFSSSHVRMWELDHKEGRALKNWCFWTVGCWRRLGSPLDSKIKPVNLKGNKSWIFIERTDAEAEAPILWPPDLNRQHIGKDPDAGKDRRQKEKKATEDEMVGSHHWLNGHELRQTPGGDEGQGGLSCYSPWSQKESDMI